MTVTESAAAAHNSLLAPHAALANTLETGILATYDTMIWLGILAVIVFVLLKSIFLLMDLVVARSNHD